MEHRMDTVVALYGLGQGCNLPFYSWMYLSCVHIAGGGGLVTRSYPILSTPWTVAHQAPPSMGFSRQEYCSGLPFPSPVHCWTVNQLPNEGKY